MVKEYIVHIDCDTSQIEAIIRELECSGGELPSVPLSELVCFESGRVSGNNMTVVLNPSNLLLDALTAVKS